MGMGSADFLTRSAFEQGTHGVRGYCHFTGAQFVHPHEWLHPTCSPIQQVSDKHTEDLGNGTFTIYAVHKDNDDPATIVVRW